MESAKPEDLTPEDLTRTGSSSQLKAEGHQRFEFSDETQRFIDLWFDDGSWAAEVQARSKTTE